jgi:hypothetical protein
VKWENALGGGGAPLFDLFAALMNERRPGRILWRSQRPSGDFNHEMDPFRYDAVKHFNSKGEN